MNEKLQAELIQIIDTLNSAIITTTDFTVEQLPDIVQQYILYGRISAAATVAVSLIVAICAVYIAVRHTKIAKVAESGMYDEVIAYWFSAILSTVTAMASMIVCVVALDKLIMVWFAPKAYLIKVFAGLLK